MASDQGSSAGRIGAALALLPDEQSQARNLVEHLSESEATPEELLVIRDGLQRNRVLEPFIEPLIASLPPPGARLSDAAVRTLGLLAAAEPGWSRWPEFADRIAGKLVQVNPFEIAAWREVFQPVSNVLSPTLRDLFGSLPERAAGPGFRAPARVRLPGGQSRASGALAGLLADADPDQFRAILRRLSSAALRERALAVILPAINVAAQGDLALAQRQARLAPSLLAFSRAELVWPMLIHRDDPSLRTELIHILVDYEVDPTVLFERLKVETNRSVRQALVLALGRFRSGPHPTALAR